MRKCKPSPVYYQSFGFVVLKSLTNSFTIHAWVIAVGRYDFELLIFLIETSLDNFFKDEHVNCFFYCNVRNIKLLNISTLTLAEFAELTRTIPYHNKTTIPYSHK